ncbi:MAG: YbbR-like domain-containing protein [Nitrospirae bacterium]|nr:YbbR-like domain-containing protein [Nitrospirota bacterium]
MKKVFFGNVGIKVLSVILAISLWIFVSYRGQTEMAVDVPIAFKNVPKGLELVRESAKVVTLNLRGHERLLKSLRPVDISVIVDMAKAKRGENMYFLDKNSIILPRPADILRVEPTSVRVVLDESVVRTLPVKASVVGTPEKGFKIVSVDVKPSSVTVEGSRTELSRLAVLRTEVIDVTGLDSDIRESVRLNTNGRNIRTKTPEVMVSVDIRR